MRLKECDTMKQLGIITKSVNHLYFSLALSSKDTKWDALDIRKHMERLEPSVFSFRFIILFPLTQNMPPNSSVLLDYLQINVLLKLVLHPCTPNYPLNAHLHTNMSMNMKHCSCYFQWTESKQLRWNGFVTVWGLHTVTCNGYTSACSGLFMFVRKVG